MPGKSRTLHAHGKLPNSGKNRQLSEILDRCRDQLPLPGVDGEQLASRLRALATPELLGLLETLDRLALIEGSLPERLTTLGVRVRR